MTIWPPTTMEWTGLLHQDLLGTVSGARGRTDLNLVNWIQSTVSSHQVNVAKITGSQNGGHLPPSGFLHAFRRGGHPYSIVVLSWHRALNPGACGHLVLSQAFRCPTTDGGEKPNYLQSRSR